MRKVQVGDIVKLKVRSKDDMAFDAIPTYSIFGVVIKLHEGGIRIAVQEMYDETWIPGISSCKQMPYDWKDFLFEHWEVTEITLLTETEKVTL